MYKEKKILALIPARSGSKGLPGKNVKSLLGRPLVAWSIREAKKSRYVDSVIVSTDDAKIAAVSRRWGAEIPFRRPAALANDKATSIDVVLHAIEQMKSAGRHYDIVTLLQPTSPLRIAEDIDNALRLLFSKRAKSVVSVCVCEHHPYWANALPGNGAMEHFLPKRHMGKNRQDLPEFYRLNGAIYLAHTDHLLKRKKFIGPGAYAYIMPQDRSVDIDCEMDFKIAAALSRVREKRR